MNGSRFGVLPQLLVVALAGCVTAAGCGDDDAIPADAGADAGLPDAGADAGVDAGSDAGPPAPAVCDGCRRDSDCGEGNLCLVLAGGERACGVACTTDDDCASQAVASTCQEEVAGMPLQCTPTASTCIESAAGDGCAGAGDCSGRYSECVDFGVDGHVCTTRCEVDADCPVGLHRCVDPGAAVGRVCTPDPDPAPERCAAMATAGTVMRCGTGGSCPMGRTCVGSGALALCLRAPVGDDCMGEGAPVMLASGARACMPDPSCACVLDEPGSMLDDALAAIGRDRCDMHFQSDLLDLFGLETSRDAYRLSFTDDARGYWPRALELAGDFAARFDCAGTPTPSCALGEAAAIVDATLEVPASGSAAGLGDALESLVTATGGAPDRAAIDTAIAGLDPTLATRLAPIVTALEHAHVLRERAVLRLGPDRARYFDAAGSLFLGNTGATLELRRAGDRGALRGDVDVGLMASGAIELAAAIESAHLEEARGMPANVRIDTPIGVVAFQGSRDDTYPDAMWHATALLVDLGGNDTYRFPAGATTDADHGLAVVVDVGGVDSYEYTPVAVADDTGPAGSHRLASDGAGRDPASPTGGPATRSRVGRQGSGRLGIGLLLDLGTEGDHYRSLRFSQGYGGLGVGMLWDAGGDDVYEGEAGMQGAGAFGIGLLYDLGGTDSYVAYAFAQGFGYTRGAGVLYDQAGDDTYVADASDVLYYSPQDPGMSNSSFAQGAGFGRRADSYPDMQYMSGGLGFLRDKAGNDHYDCGIFGQATGYWFGTGMLVDSAGNDTYDGRWYVQASAAHFGVAVLDDASGTDVHNRDEVRLLATSVGVGHDFSIGWAVDRGPESDEWRGPGLSFGSGNAAGAGFFVEYGGDERYDASGDFSFGNASVESPGGDDLRRMVGTVGVFLDADGADAYMRPTVAPLANDATWTQRMNPPIENEQGVGIDREAGRIGL